MGVEILIGQVAEAVPSALYMLLQSQVIGRSDVVVTICLKTLRHVLRIILLSHQLDYIQVNGNSIVADHYPFVSARID